MVVTCNYAFIPSKISRAENSCIGYTSNSDCSISISSVDTFDFSLILSLGYPSGLWTNQSSLIVFAPKFWIFSDSDWLFGLYNRHLIGCSYPNNNVRLNQINRKRRSSTDLDIHNSKVVSWSVPCFVQVCSRVVQWVGWNLLTVISWSHYIGKN